jgi:transposase
MYVMRPIGTPKQLKHRRRQALKLLRRGQRPTEVAQLSGVTPRSLRRWRRQAKVGPRKVRRGSRLPGRPCQLSLGQLKRLERALARGALAYDYATDYWTLERAQWLLWKKFNRRYHPSGVWHLLRRIGWSCQKPQRLALQRDEAAIAYWKRYRWPWIKKVANPGREPGFPR